MNKSIPWRNQFGFTALELMVVLIVSVSAVGWGTRYVVDYADNLAYRSAADHKGQIIDAAAKYIKDNNGVLLAAATATTPAVITVPMLKGTTPPYLPASMSNTNAFGQSYEIRVLKPAPNVLETLLVTILPESAPAARVARHFSGQKPRSLSLR